MSKIVEWSVQVDKMNKVTDIEVYIEWLDKLSEDFPSFGEVLGDKTCDGEFWDDFHSFKTEDTRYDELHLYSGMSRGVFVSENCSYAIKFAWNARGEEDCEREVAVYKAAKEQSLDFMFASVEYGFTHKGKKFYICERADADEDYALERSAVYSGREVSEIESDDPKSVQDIFYSFYAYNDVNSFLDFLDEQGINDVHMNNIGFDGHVVKCIDYAGF